MEVDFKLLYSYDKVVFRWKIISNLKCFENASLFTFKEVLDLNDLTAFRQGPQSLSKPGRLEKEGQ